MIRQLFHRVNLAVAQRAVSWGLIGAVAATPGCMTVANTIPLKHNGENVTFAPQTVVHKTVQKTTETIITPETTVETAKITYGKRGKPTKVIIPGNKTDKNKCNDEDQEMTVPLGGTNDRVKKETKKVPGTEAKKVTEVEYTTVEERAGGEAIVGYSTSGSILQAQTQVVGQATTVEGLRDPNWNGERVSERSALSQTGEFIGNLGSLGLGLGSIIFATRYEADKTTVSNNAEGGEGGDAEANNHNKVDVDTEVETKVETKAVNIGGEDGHGKKSHRPKGHRGNKHNERRHDR